jgi:hypothetical protein
MTRNTRFFVAGAAALLALTLAGCSYSATDSLGVPSISEGSSGADMAVDPGMSNESVKESSIGSSALSSDGIGGASTITTTWLSLTATNPVETADQAAVIADAAGGYVETRSESTGGGVVVPLSGVEGDATLGGTGPTGSAAPGFPMSELPVIGPDRMQFQPESLGGSGKGDSKDPRAATQLPTTTETGRIKQTEDRSGISGAPDAESVPEIYRTAVKRYFSGE